MSEEELTPLEQDGIDPEDITTEETATLLTLGYAPQELAHAGIPPETIIESIPIHVDQAADIIMEEDADYYDALPPLEDATTEDLAAFIREGAHPYALDRLGADQDNLVTAIERVGAE